MGFLLGPTSLQPHQIPPNRLWQNTFLTLTREAPVETTNPLKSRGYRLLSAVVCSETMKSRFMKTNSITTTGVIPLDNTCKVALNPASQMSCNTPTLTKPALHGSFDVSAEKVSHSKKSVKILTILRHHSNPEMCNNFHSCQTGVGCQSRCKTFLSTQQRFRKVSFQNMHKVLITGDSGNTGAGKMGINHFYFPHKTSIPQNTSILSQYRHTSLIMATTVKWYTTPVKQISA